MDLSIVIINKNNADGLKKTLLSVAGLDAEILVYDYGSTDASKETALKCGSKFYEGKFDKYERMRFEGCMLAKFDWILMLHSDEVVDEALLNSLQRIDYTNIKQVYRIQFKNYFGSRWLRHGGFGKYSPVRLANREGVQTDDENVSDEIFQQPGLVIRNIKGYILHRVAKNVEGFAQKIIHEALLWAAKSHRHGRKSSIFKLFFSPIVSFIKDYFFKLGFLDGWEGYVSAKMVAWYSFLKYARLRELNKTIKMQT